MSSIASSVKALKRSWWFAPTEVGLNKDTQLLKVVAMITMLIDHIGKMLLPQYRVLRMIGRVAFPIYAYCIAAGCVYTRDHFKYLKRLVMTALVAQPIYVLAMDHVNPQMFAVSFKANPLRAMANFYVYSWIGKAQKAPSIMLTLILGYLIIWAIREKQFLCIAAMFLLTWAIHHYDYINYGYDGVALIVYFYLFIRWRWISLPVMLVFMLRWGMKGTEFSLFGVRFGLQMFVIFALPLIYIPTHSRLKINKWVHYLYYPGHLLAILIARYLLGMLKLP